MAESDAAGRLWRALGHPVERAFATLREWHRRIRARAELTALDDRMLEDIGITRVEAEFLSDKPFRRE
ncbi:MAG TPA: DUF1127 domain-containing protein [Stellaceae bacterium]|nr:DUF1127 domain-containing protein [Stellaceae bacterium]